MRKLAVFFGGLGYTVDKPLLYYLIFKYKKLGYEIKKIEYCVPREERSFDEWIPFLFADIETQWQQVDIASFEDIVFISKSMGTVIAGLLGEKVPQARQIFLTPLNQTIPFLKKEKRVQLAVFGTADPYISAEILWLHCEKEDIPFLMFEKANHSLETADLHASLEIIEQVVDACL